MIEDEGNKLTPVRQRKRAGIAQKDERRNVKKKKKGNVGKEREKAKEIQDSYIQN